MKLLQSLVVLLHGLTNYTEIKNDEKEGNVLKIIILTLIVIFFTIILAIIREVLAS